LVSTGTAAEPSFFANATPDGGNVYFITNQQLVGQDVDNAFDLYDDREGGGLAAQWPPGSTATCEGEGCRGASPSAASGLAPGSSSGASDTRACGGLRAAARAAKQRARLLGRRAHKLSKSGG